MSSDPLKGPPRYGWPATLLASLLLVLGVRAGAEASGRAASGMLFALGPFVMLAGLHGRLEEYLHSRRRAHLLPLPIEASAHWSAAGASRRQGFAAAATLATTCMLAATVAGWMQQGWSLVAQWAAFLLLVAILEPLVPAWSAFLGRRFDEDSPASRAQSSMGGGWTQPEAVVHLYAPALMLLAAAALAMPAQLSIERAFEGDALTEAHWALTLGPVGVALYFRREGLAKYAAGVHEAVPWLQEAERTLSGPPAREGTPWPFAPLADPWLRTRGISLWRSTKAASLRLAGVGLATALAWMVAPESFALAMPFSVALLVIWLAPLGTLSGTRWRWESMTRRLPCERSAAQIDLRLSAYWALLPTLAVLLSLGLRFWSLS